MGTLSFSQRMKRTPNSKKQLKNPGKKQKLMSYGEDLRKKVEEVFADAPELVTQFGGLFRIQSEGLTIWTNAAGLEQFNQAVEAEFKKHYAV